jgi:hypothetical protein
VIRALEERKRRRADAPCLYYSPHEKQQQFHELLKLFRIAILIGANKCGKTWGGGNEAHAHAVGYRYWEVPDLKLDEKGHLPDRDTIPPKYWVRMGNGVPIPVPNTGMIVTGLARERGIGQVVWPCLKEFLPPQMLKDSKPIKGAAGVVTSFTYPNGSVILFGSADQDPLTFEGTRLQWAWVDEPVKPFVFNGLWRGLSVDQGRIFFTLTPLGIESAWMYDKWVSNTPDDVGYVKVLMTDNPGLTPQAIEEFERTGEWTEAERKARLCGDFEALGNRVIYNFDKKVHVVPAHRLPVDWTHGMTVDPHHARPPFVVWWKRSPEGVYEFYREYPTQSWTKACRSGVGIPPTELAILFRNIEAADIPNWRIGDPRFAKAETNLKGQLMTSWAQDMAAAGMPFDTRVPNVGRVETGEQQIVDMLRYNDKFPISPTNTPKILIHDCCVNLIKAFENYGILTSRTNVKLDEKRSEEWKDPIDCVRYTVLFPAYDDVGTAWDSFSDDDWRQENGGLYR